MSVRDFSEIEALRSRADGANGGSCSTVVPSIEGDDLGIPARLGYGVRFASLEGASHDGGHFTVDRPIDRLVS